MDWAAPQAPENTAKTKTAVMIIDFRPKISLNLENITRTPGNKIFSTSQYSGKVRRQALTDIAEQIGGNDPASLVEASQFSRDTNQSSRNNWNLQIGEEKAQANPSGTLGQSLK